MKSGHAPTLAAAFIYFTFSCLIWVLNGAMAPFISETFSLTPAQTGLMLSIPILAGALMRFPLGVLAQYIGRKNGDARRDVADRRARCCTATSMVDTFGDLLAMGVLLGIAGASFGVAMSLGSGSFPPQHKGLAMGLVGAGNVGTAISVLVAPPLAQLLGWQTVYGIAAVAVCVPMLVMIVFAREPDDVDAHAPLREHIACLFEKDGWAFSLIYVVTFGGFIGLTSFLPTYYYDQFGVSKVEAGQLTMLAAFMGAALRVFGGWIGDHWGGVNTLTVVLVFVAVDARLDGPRVRLARRHDAAADALLRGARRGQRRAVSARAAALADDDGRRGLDDRRDRRARRRPRAECHGAVEGVSRQLRRRASWLFAVLSLVMLGVMRFMQIRWTRTWAEKGGRRSARAARRSAASAGQPQPATRRAAR